MPIVTYINIGMLKKIYILYIAKTHYLKLIFSLETNWAKSPYGTIQSSNSYSRLAVELTSSNSSQKGRF